MINDTILAFSSEEAAQVATKAGWVDIVKDTVLIGEKTVRDDAGNVYTDLSIYSDAFIATLEICAKKYGVTVFSEGLSKLLSEIIKAWKVEQWFFSKPADKYMGHMTGYTIMELPQDWIPPYLRE